MKVGDLVKISWSCGSTAGWPETNGTFGTLIGYTWCDDNDEVLARVLFPSGVKLASWENLELVQRVTEKE